MSTFTDHDCTAGATQAREALTLAQLAGMLADSGITGWSLAIAILHAHCEAEVARRMRPDAEVGRAMVKTLMRRETELAAARAALLAFHALARNQASLKEDQLSDLLEEHEDAIKAAWNDAHALE